jgi:hypothetical protein
MSILASGMFDPFFGMPAMRAGCDSNAYAGDRIYCIMRKMAERIGNGVLVLPAVAAVAYPFALQAFHGVVSSLGFAGSPVGIGCAALLLIIAFILPLSGFAAAFWLTRDSQPWNVAACRLAYASIAAPPLFVFLGVIRGLLRIQIPELALWIGFWALAGLYVWWGRGESAPRPTSQPPGAWRVAHGLSAVLITIFVLFHLTNHLFGLLGPDIHAAIMKVGRTVYRCALIEPLLVILLLFQVTSGVRLAWTTCNVTLLGDALYNMTPFRWTGANTELRDTSGT